MVAHFDTHGGRVALALNVELSQGRHGACARIELHDRAGARLALVRLRGWIDQHAVDELTHTLDELGACGIEHVLLDCAQVRHIDYRHVPVLMRAFERYETRAGGVVVCGLSHYLRDLIRLSGCEPRLRCWPSAAELLADAGCEPSRECAS